MFKYDGQLIAQSVKNIDGWTNGLLSDGQSDAYH